MCSACWRYTENGAHICVSCQSAFKAKDFIPSSFKRVRIVALGLGVMACGVMFATERGLWVWSLAAPALCVAAGWLADKAGSLSTWLRILCVPVLKPALQVEGATVRVYGRIHCERPVVSILGRRVSVAYVAWTFDKPTVLATATPRQKMDVGSGLSIELADGERVALEPGPWRLLDPFGRGTLVAEACIDDGDDVVVRGQVALRAEAGEHYRELQQRVALLASERGLFAPAAGRYHEDRVEVRARFPTWRWAVLLTVTLAPGALARPLRQALLVFPAPAQTPDRTQYKANVGGPCGPGRECIEGAYCDERAPNAAVCAPYCQTDQGCPDGEQCDPNHRCVTDRQKRSIEGEDCSIPSSTAPSKPCARGLLCAPDFARAPAPGHHFALSCFRRCSADAECGTDQRCADVLPDSRLGLPGLCTSAAQQKRYESIRGSGAKTEGGATLPTQAAPR
jgi:hypothetical protein